MVQLSPCPTPWSHLLPQQQGGPLRTTSHERWWRQSASMCRTSKSCRWVGGIPTALFDSASADARASEIFHRTCPEQVYQPRYHSPPLPQSQPTPQLPAQISHPSREHSGAGMARPTMGSTLRGNGASIKFPICYHWRFHCSCSRRYPFVPLYYRRTSSASTSHTAPTTQTRRN